MILEERINRLDKVRAEIEYMEILAQLAEECCEAAHAALKLRRALGSGSPTPVTKGDAWRNLEEELTGVRLCMDAAGLNFRPDIYDAHLKRWNFRVEQSKNGNEAIARDLNKKLEEIENDQSFF